MKKKNKKLKKKIVAEIAWIDNEWWPSQALGSVREIRNKLADLVDVPRI